MPFRIGIVGGGIGGLTLAVALSRMNVENLIEVDIYEAAPELTQIGAGISFWPRAWKIFEKIGIESSLVEHLSPGQHLPDGELHLAFQLRKADQKEGAAIRDLICSGTPLSFHRAIVQQVLLKHLPPSIRCHLSHRLLSYSTSAHSIQLAFENGASKPCDLLIGADGIKSVIRKQFVREKTSLDQDINGDPIWTGTFAYRCMIDSEVVRQQMPGHRALMTPTIYCGKNQHLVAYPILQGRVINLAAYVSDVDKEDTPYHGPAFQDVTKDDVVPFFDKWEEEVRVLIQNMENPSRWAIHSIRPLEKYASGSVILLGDAAHAMAPHQGNGAGQAIEDAYILAHLISQAVRDQSFTNISRVYNAIRQPFVNFVQRASRVHGLLYEFNAPGFEDVEVNDESVTAERLSMLGDLIVRDWEYAWSTTAEGDLKKALEDLSMSATTDYR